MKAKPRSTPNNAGVDDSSDDAAEGPSLDLVVIATESSDAALESAVALVSDKDESADDDDSRADKVPGHNTDLEGQAEVGDEDERDSGDVTTDEAVDKFDVADLVSDDDERVDDDEHLGADADGDDSVLEDDHVEVKSAGDSAPEDEVEAGAEDAAALKDAVDEVGGDDDGADTVERIAVERAAAAQAEAEAERRAVAAQERAEEAEVDRKAAIRKAEERAAAAAEKKARRQEKKATRRDAKAAAASTKQAAKAAAAVVTQDAEAKAAVQASKPVGRSGAPVAPLDISGPDTTTAPDPDESAPEEPEPEDTMQAATERLVVETSPPSQSRKERKAREAAQEAEAEREAAMAKKAALDAKAEAAALEKAAAEERAASRGARFGRFFRSTLRRILGLAIVGGLVVGAYFAWPRIKEQYIDPVETTSAEVSTVRADVTELQNSSEQDSVRLDELIVALDVRLNEAEAANAALRAEIDALSGGQAERDSEIDALDLRIEAHDARLGDIDQLTETLGASVDATSSSLAANMSLTQASDLLSRSRLLLYQANYGLAKSDINAARAILAQVADSTAANAPLADVIARLDIAFLNLPDRPVAASADLDIAWQALISGETDGVAPPPSFIAPAPSQSEAGDDASEETSTSGAAATQADESAADG